MGGAHDPSLGSVTLLALPQNSEQHATHYSSRLEERVGLKNSQMEAMQRRSLGKGEVPPCSLARHGANLHVLTNLEALQTPSFWVFNGGFIK